jgi:organic hydroperoxide reductase OsmC/OhrA
MHPFPHHYRVTAAGAVAGDVELTSEPLSPLKSDSPAEFDGPGDRWSPETFLVGAVADCFILTFRAISSASRLGWVSLTCDVTGTLDRIDRVTQFTRFDIAARLIISDAADASRAQQALERAEHHCLITSSLKGEVRLDTAVDVSPALEMTSRG